MTTKPDALTAPSSAGNAQGAAVEPCFVAAGMPAEQEEMRRAAYAIGGWLSAALDDPNVCAEMKRDINAWFDAGMPFPDMTLSPALPAPAADEKEE